MSGRVRRARPEVGTLAEDMIADGGFSNRAKGRAAAKVSNPFGDEDLPTRRRRGMRDITNKQAFKPRNTDMEGTAKALKYGDAAEAASKVPRVSMNRPQAQPPVSSYQSMRPGFSGTNLYETPIADLSDDYLGSDPESHMRMQMMEARRQLQGMQAAADLMEEEANRILMSQSQRIESLKKQLNDKTVDAQHAEKMVRALEDQCSALRRQNRQTGSDQAVVDELREQLQQVKEEKVELQTDNDHKTGQMKILEQENRKLEQRMAKLELEAQRSSKKLQFYRTLSAIQTDVVSEESRSDMEGTRFNCRLYNNGGDQMFQFHLDFKNRRQCTFMPLSDLNGLRFELPEFFHDELEFEARDAPAMLRVMQSDLYGGGEDEEDETMQL